MPARSDLDTIVLLGSGPIVIGQACEFDYSGTQACKALRALGYRVALVNSNPATIMTDPEFADATYIEPLTPASVAHVLEAERAARGHDAGIGLLPTLGGQTALNLAIALDEQGVLDRLAVELIGAGIDAIQLAEDRRRFSDAMAAIGLDVAGHVRATTFAETRAFAEPHGFPLLVRSSYTLGGAGSGVARDAAEFERMVGEGLAASPIGEVQIDESLLGWKEFELEVMRDAADSCVVVCPIENIDPMGVHTGDSVTVAPTLTLPDPDYQRMRDASFAVMREIGVATGGSNVQFALHPETGRMCVVEMNPRVSRSSALASKATGFPIAKIAAQLAVGLTLDEIANDITGRTKAAFEPTIDYVVTKIPRFAFEKFPGVDQRLTSRMKSVGEVMAIGRTFPESLGKALASLEDGTTGLDPQPAADTAEWWAALGDPTPDRLLRAAAAPGLVTRGAGKAHDAGGAHAPDPAVVDRVAAATGYDRWVVDQIAQAVAARCDLGATAAADPGDVEAVAALRAAKRAGISDALAAGELGVDEAEVRQRRRAAGLTPVHKTVDTCAGEFPAVTPYHYSTYETESEVAASPAARVIILGSGPNRIGQGIEFDYCCVHAVSALRAAGYETVMVNCNPETVSTDYDTADRLYFEPLTAEHVLAVHDAELAATADADHPDGDPAKVGVMVQLGGQTPLKLARDLAAAGVTILGTQPDAIDLAEDRGQFAGVLDRIGISQPDGGMAAGLDEALAVARRVGFPVLVRPSYVLGGRAMEIVYTAEQMRTWLEANAGDISPTHPVLIDKFLESAIEVDVDAVYDGHELFLGGIMEHIEEAGVHSGDSACVIPPYTLGRAQIAQLRDYTERIADALGTRGLINVQYAVRDHDICVIEANPRASRTVPFVSKATGVPLAKVAARVMAGATLAELRREPGATGAAPWVPAADAASAPEPRHVAVKEAVLPFDRFPGVDSRLGPEMRSTGEVMGLDRDFGVAFAKSQAGTGSMVLPTAGTVFASIANRDKRAMVYPVKRLAELGFHVVATEGTAETLQRAGVKAEIVIKHGEGGPGQETVVDRIRAGEVDLVLNTPMGSGPRVDGYEIRTAAVTAGVPCITTLSGILAAVQGIESLRQGGTSVRPLQAYHAELDVARVSEGER